MDLHIQDVPNMAMPLHMEMHEAIRGHKLIKELMFLGEKDFGD